jgi:hypothetical protein
VPVQGWVIYADVRGESAATAVDAIVRSVVPQIATR